MATSKRRMAKKRVKILLTDGERTVNLAWVEHNGDNLYLGPALAFQQGGLPLDHHFSYHSTGRRTVPTNSIVAALPPIRKITGHVAVLTMWIQPDLINREYVKPFKGKMSQDDFLIDARSIPQSGANILIGLLEPGKDEELPRHSDFEIRQKMIVRSVSPCLAISLACRKETDGEHV